ncbi:uncharacterized protein LOC123982933 isoform X2 [Micropterus dolomieu]|uniref:uncharacterized protein LOC123982933 isoform X2 n=1 Tax=Micropterus dolomieu TaxID=147949 RepID=UPI001E8DFD20|nr:uncharacterized protein LOC123982933 isoform X2 [Micropterus dolomieu]
MKGGLQVLLLAVFMLLARCQNIKVSMYPPFKEVFSGDSFYLHCEKSTSGNTVKWYMNNTEQQWTNEIQKIEVAAPEHTGLYRCEVNGQKSEIFNISVLEYLPIASLVIKTGLPVMQTGGSVVLELENEDGLQGWTCWVYRPSIKQIRRIALKLKNDSVNLAFQTYRLVVPETIFWCTDRNQDHRSNQITVRTSGKAIALEMDPLPALAGGSITLKCVAWGTDKISRAVFYKNNTILQDSQSSTYTISYLTEKVNGDYKCNATYKHVASTGGPPYEEVSDNQDLFVQEPPMKPVLSSMTCSCPGCPSDAKYRWYNMDHKQLTHLDFETNYMKPDESGTYACQAMWKNMRTRLSNTEVYHHQIDPTGVVMVIGTVVFFICAMLCIACAAYKWYKKRHGTGAIYEDVAMKSREKGDDQYEELQKPRGAQKEGEYDTLHPDAPGKEKKESEYEPLKKEEMKDGVYHSLGTGGAVGGDGGYEALKKEGMKEGLYQSLGVEGAVGGDGGYEALKKEGMKEGLYQSLGVEGAVGGDGGYEALKKEGMKEGLYQSLGVEGAVGGDGGYEALKKEGMKEGLYQSLGVEGAVGGDGGYEALKKEGMKEGLYQSLGVEGAVGGDGGYEALKKEGMKEGLYQSLGVEGAVGGDGGYEALKKEGMKEGLYQSLGVEGAVGGDGGYEALKKEGMKEGLYQSLGVEGAVGGDGGYEALGKAKDKDYEIVDEKKQEKADEQKTKP